MTSIKKVEDKTLLIAGTSKNESQKRKNCSVILSLTVISIIFVITLILTFSLGGNNSSDESSAAGMIGLWPCYGGGLKNQQKSENTNNNIILTRDNIQNINTDCIYTSPDGSVFMGYPAIDDNNNAYFSDASGYITCINLNTCQTCWRQRLANILFGYNESYIIIAHQSLTLFQDSNGNQGILFGGPSIRNWIRDGITNLYSDNFGCYVIALYLNNGS